jgi:hypothetical protein
MNNENVQGPNRTSDFAKYIVRAAKLASLPRGWLAGIVLQFCS